MAGNPKLHLRMAEDLLEKARGLGGKDEARYLVLAAAHAGRAQVLARSTYDRDKASWVLERAIELVQEQLR